MRPKSIITATLTDDADGIAEDQTTAAAADLVLDGALVTDGVATAAEAQIVTIEGAGNSSGITFTISGDDADGRPQSQTITGPNAASVVTTAFFKTVTQISTSGAVTGDVEVGWLEANGAVTRSYPTNWRQSPYNQAITVAITGTLTATIQHTTDGPFDSYTNTFSTDADWRATTGLAAITADDEDSIGFPVQAVRGIITAYTSGTLKFTTIQGQNS